jgi:hypothetical protein
MAEFLIKPGVAVLSAGLPSFQQSINHVALGFDSGIRGACAGLQAGLKRGRVERWRSTPTNS